MWTNVFKIGGLHQISWFQFLPSDSDTEKSAKVDEKDACTLLVLSSHLQLQKEGFLSTWTNSFVGPWDPSQGMHNPDEKIKLWLFLPGCHSSVVENAQAAVSKLRVVTSGLWLAPGESEEVASALSKALRNCIERALREISYLRYGDVFMRCYPFSQSEKLFRRVQPVIEFIFTATEEAIYVHVKVSAKHIRTLSGDDMERLLRRCSLQKPEERLPVIVAPHGMRGRLSGCCPTDLVKHVYLSSGRVNTSDGFTVLGIPSNIAQASACQFRGQNCYVEVTLGRPANRGDKAVLSNSNSSRNVRKRYRSEAPVVALGRGDHKYGSADHSQNLEKTFLYPVDAVVVPVIHTSFVRSSLKRLWLQNLVGTSLLGSYFLMNCSGFESISNGKSVDGSWIGSSGIHSQNSDNSSSNSNSSSISSTSSDSDCQMTSGAGDLEADADSLTCRQSGLPSSDQLDGDAHKQVSKRPRTGTTESFGATGTVINTHIGPYKSGYSSVEVNISTTGVGNDLVTSDYWDDNDRDSMDIQVLLSDFGDFGDFFENDGLPFGEPPGTAESQALIYAVPDCVDVSSSPGAGAIDTDQILPASDVPSFDSLNPFPLAVTDELRSKKHEFPKETWSSGPVTYSSALSAGEFDHLSKAEATMIFAPDYGAVETPVNEMSTSIFRVPYIPSSRKVDSTHSSSDAYVYGATPPYLTALDDRLDVTEVIVNSRGARQDSSHSVHLKKYYTHVKNGKERRDIASNDSILSCEVVTPASFSGFNSVNAVKSVQGRSTGSGAEVGHFLFSVNTVLATETESMRFQAAMCRIRHTLLSSSKVASSGVLSGNGILDHPPGDQVAMAEKNSNRYEVKKKESIPVRIAGDFDGGMLDGSVSAPIGVWRSVGVPKSAKATSSLSMENTSSSHLKSSNEECRVIFGQRQPLQDLLDALPFLVQQATSFVDVTLDAEYCDGPFAWLALEEQCRRGFSCGPSMVHAGCGGLLASCHSLDIAGVELLDPLSTNVHASSVISLLHSDIKVALKGAFGNLDGPLSVTDWCKSRSHLGDAGTINEGYTGESTIIESKDASSTGSLSVGEPISPTISSVSSTTDGMRVDETIQRRLSQEVGHSESEQQMTSRPRPSLFLQSFPSILVGYQDDWLKTSAASLQVWEKAPLEPYALQKPMNHYVVCPDIDPLTSAAADFFLQLGSVFETCKLGTHASQNVGGQMDPTSRKWKSSGFVLIDCPQKMKIECSSASFMGSISDYLLALSNGWDLRTFLESLSTVLKNQRFDFAMNQKEGNDGPGTVIYVVCPFPDPVAVLQTLIASSTALGSTLFSSDKDRRSLLHTQVGKGLGCSAAADESSLLNVLALSGFSIPKLVLQIVTVEAILRVTSPSLNEISLLKEIAFTVYNKMRRVARGTCNDLVQSSGISVRPQSTLMPISSPNSGIWKECVPPRMSGSLPREGELDSLRPGTWDNSWQASRTGGLSSDPNKAGDNYFQDDAHFLFEPLFILAEPGSMELGVSPSAVGSAILESSRPSSDDGYGGSFIPSSISGGMDNGACSILDASDSDGIGSSNQKNTSLHCCYGWTEDWRWLVSVWTDSRGELLDSHIFPFGGISGRQDTKGLQCLFVQVLHQGCQILSSSSTDIGSIKPRDIIITRIGCFYELERQEWQKAIYLVGGNEVKKWPLQLRKCVPDGISASSNGNVLPQQEMGLIQERTLPSSPSPSLYAHQTKTSGFIKGGLGQSNARKQLMGRQATVDCSRGLFQWVHSISLIGVSLDRSMQLMSHADASFPGGGAQGGGVPGSWGYLEGFSAVKSLGSTSASYIVIPPNMHFLPSTPLQLPTCLTSDSPPLAHLLHSKGSATPLSSGFVVSKAVASIRNESRSSSNEEWPSVLSVSLVDYYGSSNINQEKIVRGSIKKGRSLMSDIRDHETEINLILEFVAAELNALSWMTVSPAYLERRTALPFHCDMILRLTRLIHFADKELSQKQDTA